MQSLKFAFALILLILSSVNAIPHDQITAAPQYCIGNSDQRSSNGDVKPELVKRDYSIGINTCGWINGDPQSPWILVPTTVTCFYNTDKDFLGIYSPTTCIDCHGSYTFCATAIAASRYTGVFCDPSPDVESNIESTFSGMTAPIAFPIYSGVHGLSTGTQYPASIAISSTTSPPVTTSSSTPFLVSPTSSLTPPTSSLAPPTSSLTPPTSSLTPPTSSLAPPTSSLTPPTSSLTPPTSSSTPPTNSLTPPTSSLTTLTSSSTLSISLFPISPTSTSPTSISPALTSPTPTPKPKPVGAIVGGVLGGLVITCATALGMALILRRKKSDIPQDVAPRYSMVFPEQPELQADPAVHEHHGGGFATKSELP